MGCIFTEELVDIIFEVDLKELDNINFPIGELFGLIVNFNDVKYEFLIKLKYNSEKLIVLGAGALGFDSKHDRSKPYFNRWSWDFNESIICYNDPTMYIHDDLRSGWGIGDINNYYLENIAGILMIFADCLELKYSNIIFFGSSAGGFMSIILATLIKGSTAIADIPQLNLMNYYEWDDLKKHCFNGMSDELILKKFNHRINVISMFQRENYIPNAILVFDCSVTPDINLQYAPFLSDLNQLPFNYNTNCLKIVINGKNIGHAPLSKSDSFSLVEEVIMNNLIDENDLSSNFMEKNNNLKLKLKNSYNEFSLLEYSFLIPKSFSNLPLNSKNSLRFTNNNINLFISIFGRDGDYCEENFNNVLNNIGNDVSLNLISSKIFNFAGDVVYNLKYDNGNYECIYLICKLNKTFRITFSVRNYFSFDEKFMFEIFKIIVQSLVYKNYIVSR